MITKYKLYKYQGGCRIRRLSDLERISCFWDLCDDPEPVPIKEYQSREEARADLANYEHDVHTFNHHGMNYLDVVTYAITEEHYDENESGEFDPDLINGEDVTPLEIPHGFELDWFGTVYRYDRTNVSYPEWVEVE